MSRTRLRRSLIYRNLSRRIRAMFGSQLDIQTFVGSFWARCVGHVLAVVGMRPDFQAFAVSGTWCAGHVKDVVGTHPDFHIFLVFGTRCAGLVQDADAQGHARMQPDFQAFLGSFGYGVQAASGMRPGHCRDAALFSGICRQFVGMVCRQCLGCIQSVAGAPHNFQAFLGNFWDSMCRPCLGRIMVKAVTEADFQAILGSFMDTVCKPCPGCGRDASRLLVIFRQFLEHDVQAMSGLRMVRVSWTRCPGNVRDLSWLRQLLGRGAQAMFETRLGRDRDAALFLDISTQFLGHGVQAMSWPWPRLGRVLTTVGTPPDFQAFAMSRTHPSRSRDAARFLGIYWQFMGPDVQAMSETYHGHGILRKFLEHGVQAMFEMHLGRDRNATRFPGISRPCSGRVMAMAGTESDFQAILCSFGTRCAVYIQDAIGTHPDFQVFLGSFWSTVCNQCSGRFWAAVGMQPSFQAFLGSLWDMAIFRMHWGYCRDAARFRGSFRQFLETVCRPCPGYDKDAARFSGIFRLHPGRVLATIGMQPNFQAFVGILWARCAGHVPDASMPRLGYHLIFRHFMAISRTRCVGHVRDASWPR
ncbi:Hypothetical predicted protein [Olea europaea subsp. europaea]|uniref:Uncharacterized protein n=1 Tax=Olea europaea subsp. europaea TaxID=158383 RepID=A0A8S0TTJ7_OLEEU|nr:Hypothetical predicted protein [Olea europaea subsp. europaea]